MLGNLHDYDPSKHAVPYAELPELDRYMLGRLAEVMAEALTLTLTLTLTPTPTPTQTQTQALTLTLTLTSTVTGDGGGAGALRCAPVLARLLTAAAVRHAGPLQPLPTRTLTLQPQP